MKKIKRKKVEDGWEKEEEVMKESTVNLKKKEEDMLQITKKFVEDKVEVERKKVQIKVDKKQLLK